MNSLYFWLFSSPVKFDMGAYTSSKDDTKVPVILRISKTQLYVSAQDEDQPVLLKVSCPFVSHLPSFTSHMFVNKPNRQTPLTR